MWQWPHSLRQGLIATIVATGLTLQLLPFPAFANALDDVRAGNEFFKAGRLAEAVEAYTKAVTSGELQSETLAITYNNRGVALGEQNEFGRAIEDYKKALQLMPEDATTRKNLRVAYIKRGLSAQTEGQFDEAATDLDAAIATDPAHYLGYLRRAELNVARGNLALAVSDYKLALERNPGDNDLVVALSQAREALSRPSAAGTASDVAAGSPTGEESSLETAIPEPAPVPSEAVVDESPVEAAEDRTTAAVAPATENSPASAPSPDANDIEPGAGEVLMITLGSVNVRDAPRNAGVLITTVGEGVVLPVLGEELGWKRVRLSDGREGFIYRRWMGPVENGN